MTKTATISLLAVCSAALAFLLGVVVWFCLPWLVQGALAARVGSLPGIRSVSFRIDRIGLDGFRVEDIRVGDPDRPALAVASLRADYRPAALFRGRIDRVILDGVDVEVDLAGSRPTLAGLDPAAVAAGIKRSQASSAPSPGFLPVVGRIEFGHVTLNLNRPLGRESIPLEITAIPDGQWQRLDLVCRAALRGQRLMLLVGLDLGQGLGRAEMTAGNLDLERLAGLVGFKGIQAFSGTGQIAGQADFRLAPFALVNADLTADIHRAAFLSGGNRIEAGGASSDGPAVRLHGRLAKDGGAGFDAVLSVPELTIGGPAIVRFSKIHGKVLARRGQIRVSGGFDAACAFPQAPFRVRTPTGADVAVGGAFSGTWVPGGPWTLRLDASDQRPGPWQAGFGRARAEARRPRLGVAGKGQGRSGTFDLTLKAQDLVLDRNALVARAPGIDVFGRLTMAGGRLSRATMDLAVAGATLEHGKVALTLPRLSVGASMDPETGRVRGRLDLDRAVLSDSGHDLRLEGISARVPFQWPGAENNASGTAGVQKIVWRSRDMGSVGAELGQRDNGLVFSGSHESRAFPGLTAVFSGQALWPLTAGIHVLVPAWTPDGGMDLKRISPEAKGARLNGALTASGRLDFDGAGLKGDLTVGLHQGQFAWPQRDLEINGIDGDLTLVDLSGPRSAPDQRLTFSSARMGAVRVSDGRFAFQVEPGNTLLLEGAQFGWCGGRIFVQAGRFTPGNGNYGLTLYCDRLKLAQVLAQLSSVRAEGGGTVSGRIPLRVEKGRLVFDDGFLFSTPGEEGKIRVTGTEILTAGIPADTLQFAQLDLARAALEDYDYQWVKLNLSTEGQDLHLRMQVDGQPGGPLPFVFDKTLGGFVRVTGASPGSRFQGIGLDVNFRLPLDQVLHYGGTLRDAMPKAQ